uniref:VAMP712 protein n=1 Tax=Fopius arisanus TaxID=64838 RepID=A0A0C9QMV8_9HYME
MKTKVLYTVIVYPNKDSRQVIACHPRHGTNHYRNIVIAAMQDLTTIDEDRISITRDKFTVHLVFGELWYACLTPIEGSPVAASEVSLEVQEFLGHVRSVYRELPILADLSRELPNSSAGDLSRPLGKILERYGQETIINLTPKVHQELQDIRTILLDSMQRLIDRGERLDELVKKSANPRDIGAKGLPVHSKNREGPEKLLRCIFICCITHIDSGIRNSLVHRNILVNLGFRELGI